MKFWKPIGSWKQIRHPRWYFLGLTVPSVFSGLINTGSGIPHHRPPVAYNFYVSAFLRNARIDLTTVQLIDETRACRNFSCCSGSSTSATGWPSLVFSDGQQIQRSRVRSQGSTPIFWHRNKLPITGSQGWCDTQALFHQFGAIKFLGLKEAYVLRAAKPRVRPATKE